MSSPANPQTTPPVAPVTEVPRKTDYIAGILSYLIPGLGQVYQGRILKGVVFFVSLYTLFFWGMALGSWQNVFLPKERRAASNAIAQVLGDLYGRPQFAGQVCIGIAAWPGLLQYSLYEGKAPVFGEFQSTPSSERINELSRGDSKSWDLGWVYTVIAGVLNILIIYDALVGPAFREGTAPAPKPATT